MLLQHPFVLCLIALSSISCGDSGSSSTPNEHFTLVAVSPDDFLGDVSCSSAVGDMQAYVATLVDLTDDGQTEALSTDEFPLPSSSLIACDKTVTFSRVRPGRVYSARVDGYTTTDAEPLTPGSPTLLDRASGAPIRPTWSTRCGNPASVGLDAPAVALSRNTVFVRGCAPLGRLDYSDSLGIDVDLDSALGMLLCGTAPGEISKFRLLGDDVVLADSVECGLDAVSVELPFGMPTEIRLEAFSADASTAEWAAPCQLSETDQSPPGIVVCQALTADGQASLGLRNPLESNGTSCESLVSIVISEAGTELLSSTTLDCDTAVELASLPAGEHELVVSTFDATGASGPTLTCSLTISPAASTPAVCVADG